MKAVDTFSEAIWGLASRPARTLATLVALGISVATIALVAGVLGGFEKRIEQLSFGAYGRSLVIRENFFVEDRVGSPRLSDIDRLRQAVPGVEAVAAWRILFAAEIDAGREHGQTEVFGVFGDYRREASTPLAEGRHITDDEAQSARRVCVLGDQAARRFFPNTSALNKLVRINGISCTVVGVLGVPENRISERYAPAILTPFGAASRYFTVNTVMAPDEASQITLILNDSRYLDRAQMWADRLLRRRYGIPFSQPSPFVYADPSASVRSLRQQRDLVSRLLLVIAGVGLISGLIGYGSAVAAAASERRREVALRRTLGASRTDIVLQFMTENAVLGILGGALGGVLALGIGLAASKAWDWPIDFNPSVFGISALLGLLCGLVFGALPARKAASAPPAGAVRA
ncbi:MAG: hypothetical protein CMF74_11105 [Maricaulis sp.]|jgi:putative ABC transport system permease protein|nr:hypothetical protein [Maricaulis sp.]